MGLDDGTDIVLGTLYRFWVQAAHYALVRSARFFPSMLELMPSLPVIATVWEGDHAVAALRRFMGSKTNLNPDDTDAGSAR